MKSTRILITAVAAAILGAGIGSVATYSLVDRSRPDKVQPTQESSKPTTPSPVFSQLQPDALVGRFAPQQSSRGSPEQFTKTDVHRGVHRKYYSLVLTGPEVNRDLMAVLDKEIPEKKPDDEIKRLNPFEKEVPAAIERAGGKVETRNIRRGQVAGLIHCRYSFPYTIGSVAGEIQIWLIGKDDHCTVIVIVDEYPEQLRSRDLAVPVLP